MGMTERMPVDPLQASPLACSAKRLFFLCCPLHISLSFSISTPNLSVRIASCLSVALRFLRRGMVEELDDQVLRSTPCLSRRVFPDLPRRGLRNVNHTRPVVTKDGLDRLRIQP